MKPLKDRSLEIHGAYIGFTSNPVFKDLTLSAKVVYNELLYRHQLSMENPDFQDEDGTPFILYAQDHIAAAWSISLDSIQRAMKSLEKIGLISVHQQGQMKLNKVYVYNFSETAKCGFMKPQNAARETAKCHPYNKQYNKADSKSSSTNVESHRPVAGRDVPVAAINGSLFKTPAKTKTEKNAEKWYRERCTQLNGKGFASQVETALRRFLKTLGETKKSADQITQTAWEVQLEDLRQYSEYPDLQQEAVYNACGYRNMRISVAQVMKRNNVVSMYDFDQKMEDEQPAPAAPPSREEMEEF